MKKEIKTAWTEYIDASNKLYDVLNKRSGNFVGEMAEQMANDYYEGTLELPSNKSYDLIDTQGNKVQVKSRRITNSKKKGNLSDIRENQIEFDLLLVILFNNDGTILLVKEFSKNEVFKDLALHNQRNNASVISVNKVIKSNIGKDLTEDFIKKI